MLFSFRHDFYTNAVLIRQARFVGCACTAVVFSFWYGRVCASEREKIGFRRAEAADEAEDLARGDAQLHSDGAQAERLVTILMGDKVEPRREYISQYADFNREDSFTTLTDSLEEGGKRS